MRGRQLQGRGRYPYPRPGRGRMPGADKPGSGPFGGKCICPKCGYSETHTRADPCNQIKCPKCGSILTRA